MCLDNNSDAHNEVELDLGTQIKLNVLAERWGLTASEALDKIVVDKAIDEILNNPETVDALLNDIISNPVEVKNILLALIHIIKEVTDIK